MSEEKQYEGFIGVFDSGVGGISILKELVRELPDEKFIYFGDSANAPYGEKSIEQVQELSLRIADRMAAQGVKAIVIACNTATSAAVGSIREKYNSRIPVIGIEPALKPAAREEHNGRILVMATPVTLRLEKYHNLSGSLAGEAEFVPVACDGLAGRIEKGNLDAPDVHELLEKLIGSYRGTVDGVVLGCTHYPFVKRQIRAVLGVVPMFDGGAGTARELRRQLEQRGLRAAGGSGRAGEVIFASSIPTEEELELYRRFLAAEC